MALPGGASCCSPGTDHLPHIKTDTIHTVAAEVT